VKKDMAGSRVLIWRSCSHWTATSSFSSL